MMNHNKKQTGGNCALAGSTMSCSVIALLLATAGLSYYFYYNKR